MTAEVWGQFVKRAKLPQGLDMRTALRNLHLVRDDQMTHAGAWLLSDDITRISVSASVTCALFRGTHKAHILDRKEFTGDLYTIYEDCMAYLQSKLNTALIPHATGRDERLELPVDALREALVNAIAHRDYRSTANVQVYIFHDRVEIVTPGGLPAGMREEDLGVKSVPRNPLLFGIFHRMDLVEHIGSGIRRIRDRCRDYGVAEPKIEVSDSWVTVVFTRPAEQAGDQVGTKSGQSRDQTGAGAVRQVPGKYPTSTRQVLAALASADAELSRAQLQKAAEFHDREHFVNEHLNPLLVAGLVEMTIPDKPRSSKQRYRITEKGREVLAIQDESRGSDESCDK
jgi:ATP-dependent DNA helicase RecG